LRVSAFSATAVIIALFILSLFAGVLPISIGGGADSVGTRIPDQGTAHINRGVSHPEYNSVPATSGWHYSDESAPARWGVYEQVLPDEVLVHNLEHGGVGVHYNCPDGCEELVSKLSEIVGRSTKVIMSPYPDMDTAVALTAWNYIDKFDEFDEDRIIAFIRGNVSSPNAPEWEAR
jgi:hypothetical protein